MRTRLQAEHKAWLDIMYPGQPWQLPAAGMVEEAGELLHAILAKEREAIWGLDHRYKDLSEDIEDAIGDCAIYACSLCNAMEWHFVELTLGTSKDDGDNLALAVSLIAIGAVNFKEPSEVNVRHYLSYLKRLACRFGIPFWATIQKTWAKVKERRR